MERSTAAFEQESAVSHLASSTYTRRQRRLGRGRCWETTFVLMVCRGGRQAGNAIDFTSIMGHIKKRLWSQTAPAAQSRVPVRVHSHCRFPSCCLIVVEVATCEKRRQKLLTDYEIWHAIAARKVNATDSRLRLRLHLLLLLLGRQIMF